MPKRLAAKTPSFAMQLTPQLVARTLKFVEDEGPEPNWTPISSTQLDDLVSRVEEEAGDEEIWVFAYGSLMWNPGFEVAASEEAVAYGWHRSFSLRIERFRATSDAPGLMLALRPGGSCSGLVLKLPCTTKRENLRTLLAREIRYAEVCDMARWVAVKTPTGIRPALTFWASNKQSPLTEKIPLEEAAGLIAQACGPAGSCAEYLHRTVLDLAGRNIYDRNLWQLQQMVAARLRALPEDDRI
ncbi:gamma-glutamylcyclotransferase [Rhizobium bangladeshense]|uniref:gamma-glutamylcyclotransferase n=1 Tax=Rhizobium bangladeshense TaxID=1138189 RepID=UPI001A99DD76|nr:gamma-glutamylcyclotransferase [Rhizobium bangladeshense]MBX4915785.1 gamma-glutamylcyclotransferase [Rhizobium bangladeshense]QSY96971.1 gamma-glutamylcyclotransferase [Rhizobium bangladeshense]